MERKELLELAFRGAETMYSRCDDWAKQTLNINEQKSALRLRDEYRQKMCEIGIAIQRLKTIEKLANGGIFKELED